MSELKPSPSPHDFSGVHAALRGHVERNILPGVSHAVLRGRELIDVGCTGWADIEDRVPLRTDHLFRAMSNTKLVTSIAALLLWEEGRFDLDEPAARFVPQLAALRVLRPGATAIDDTEALASPITIRQLFTHSAGLSYGLLDPGSLLFKAYNDRRMISNLRSTAQMVDLLTEIPLKFQPGTGWEYSVATDVLGHLIAVVSGQTLSGFFRSRIFQPLGMADTGFVIPEDQHHRLVAYYGGADPQDPSEPGLKKLVGFPHPDANLKPLPRVSGGGGLVSSLGDMVTLLRSLVVEGSGAPTILKPATIAMMMSNHLPPGQNISTTITGEIQGRGFGLGGCVTLKPADADPAAATGEFQWGGLAGTHWWISPRTGLSGVLMTQRHMGFWNPFAFDFKQRVYAAVLGAQGA
jgi:CubicO group peptidase (beta-lactamase class C family)